MTKTKEKTPDKTQLIQWSEKTVTLDEIKPFENNPRTITESQYGKLKQSLESLGQFRPLTVTHDMKLAGGHQRLQVMRELGWSECRVSYPLEPISDEQYREILVRDNVNNGLFDWDMMANSFDLEELRDWGIPETFNVAPEQSGGDNDGAWRVKCPGCDEEFPVKGHKV